MVICHRIFLGLEPEMVREQVTWSRLPDGRWRIHKLGLPSEKVLYWTDFPFFLFYFYLRELNHHGKPARHRVRVPKTSQHSIVIAPGKPQPNSAPKGRRLYLKAGSHIQYHCAATSFLGCMRALFMTLRAHTKVTLIHNAWKQDK